MEKNIMMPLLGYFIVASATAVTLGAYRFVSRTIIGSFKNPNGAASMNKLRSFWDETEDILIVYSAQ